MMTTAIEQHQSTGMTFADKKAYAVALADASLLPRQYQKQPGNVLLAIELGESLQIPPIQAINTIHVIEGKPSASAALISALVRRSGHKLRVTGDDERAVAQIVRHDDPDYVYEVEWNLDRAKKAGLLSGKDNWAKYPAAMLKARAITEVARDACQEALMGIQYTPEELGAVVDQDGNPVQMTNPQTPPRRQRRQAAKPDPAPARESSGRDWLAELDQCETAQQVRDLYTAANQAGELTDELKNDITAAGIALAQNESAETVDAEIVDENGVIQEGAV